MWRTVRDNLFDLSVKCTEKGKAGHIFFIHSFVYFRLVLVYAGVKR